MDHLGVSFFFFTLVFLRNWALPGVVLGWVTESVSLSGDHLVLSHGPPLPHVADLPHVASLPGVLLRLLPHFRDPVPGADSVPRGQVSRVHGRLNLPTGFFSRRGAAP